MSPSDVITDGHEATRCTQALTTMTIPTSFALNCADTLEEASHASWPLLAVGYALVLVYVGVYFSVERTPKGSLWPLRVATTPPTVFTALSAVLLIVFFLLFHKT